MFFLQNGLPGIFLIFWRGEFDIKSFIIELILLISKGLLKDLQLVASKTVLISSSQLDVLKDTFERVLQDTFQTVIPTHSQQKFSGLSWMVKRYYIQDYPENFRGDTETTRTTASDFIRPSIESSLTRREKKTQIKHVVWVEGRWLFTSF